MDRPFIIENARERERLRALINRVTDEELHLPMEAGWTIASALGHLAAHPFCDLLPLRVRAKKHHREH